MPGARILTRGRLVGGGLLLLLGCVLGPLLLGPRAPLPPDLPPGDLHPAVAKALQAARRDVLEHPRSAPAWGRYGMVLDAHECRTEAVRCWREAARLDPREVKWACYLATSSDPAHPADAVAGWEACVWLRPEDGFLQLRLAEARLSAGQWDAAEIPLRTAVELRLDDGRAWYRLAQWRARREDWPGAVEAIERAAALLPQQREILQERIAILVRSGRSDDARDLQKRSPGEDRLVTGWPDPYLVEIRQLRRDPYWIFDNARRQLAGRQTSEALLQLESLVRDDPEEPLFAAGLATAYLEQQRRSDAVAVLEQSLRRHPAASQLWALLGTARLLVEDWDGAIDAYRKSLALKPDQGGARQDLAFCLEQTGDVAGAIREYRQAIALNPRAETARQRLQKLQPLPE